MTSDISKRIIWAVDLLAVAPDDHILEIGCGNGAAVSLVCKQLRTGSITAIDRSEEMVARASARNAGYIAAGRAVIKHCDLLTAKLPTASFNKIFLFNLNVFWMDPVAELNEIRRLLTPAGSVIIFHNPPPGAELTEYADAICKNLAKNGFVADEPIFEDSVVSLCIRSQHL